jgi:aspartyl-tRNA(Asn)/glutamyl-tRNA(Gln) amidotransferase subunit C
MKIDDKLVTYLEDLSFLSLSNDEKSRLADDLQKIIDGIDKLSGLDTGETPEYSFSFNNVNIFRDDEVSASFDRELILKNAPVRNDEFFVAPKTVE